MDKNTLKNIFHMYCFYIVRFQDGAEPHISRNKLIYRIIHFPITRTLGIVWWNSMSLEMTNHCIHSTDL